MADGEGGGMGGLSEPGASHGGAYQPGHHDAGNRPSDILTAAITATSIEQATSPVHATPNPFSRHHSTLDLDDYFTGPRDMSKHSKWPIFLQLHGSILPKMILPLVCVGAWATLIFCLSFYSVFGVSLAVNNVLLTITGFVVSLGLSFRSSTAYERYAEGRRYWASLVLAGQNLGRVFWIHTVERPGEQGQKDVLAKLTAMNLLVTFAVSLKHKLRYEPYTNDEDIASLVSHLDTYAQAATREEPEKVEKAMRRPGFLKNTGEYLGVSFAASNPRKVVKRAQRPLGNLPLEVLSYLAAYVDETIDNKQLPIPMQQTLAYNNLAVLNDVLVGTERVLTTPLPIAYSIAIAQITWVYIILLPFQLIAPLSWVTIPASVAAAYIILGLLFIGREVENPFGSDVNDLPLESYCEQVARDMDIIASRPKPRNRDWIETIDNKVFWPLSHTGWNAWLARGDSKVREAIRQKVELGVDKTGKGHAKNPSSEKTSPERNGNVTVSAV